MISKNKIKQIKSLARKKFRQKDQLFLVEGDKNVLEVLDSDIRVKELYATESFLAAHKQSIKKAGKTEDASSVEIKKASLLKHPQDCLAICALPPPVKLPGKLTGFSLYLDGIRDPGNLGTIIRVCDWFGMEYLFCSPDTADVYNPKVIQSSMGSFCRVQTVYAPFNELSEVASESLVPVYGTFLEGNNIYSENFFGSGLVVLGNEGRGISLQVAEKISHKLSIPSFSKNKNRAESLNVAIASGIICSELSRQSNRPTFIQNEN